MGQTTSNRCIFSRFPVNLTQVFSSSQTSILVQLDFFGKPWTVLFPSHTFPGQLHQCYQSDFWLLLVSVSHLQTCCLSSHSCENLWVFSAPVSLPWLRILCPLPPPVRYLLFNSLKLFVGHMLSMRLFKVETFDKKLIKKLLGIVKFLYISLSFYLLSLVFFWRWQHPFLIKTIRTGTTKDSAYILWKNLQNIYQTADKKHTRPLWQADERKVILGDC